ncbi:MAG: hypothetical protein EBU90_15785 [Proteobacteria bacterium]|nr:hypothetical protein [Pseudomonadota bacterium]NBP15964.1 hypothetical protein [bacterium]
MSIFVQIAAYRDPELVPTLRDCIKNAKFPENLKFCIAWQRAPSDSLEEFATDSRFKILDIPYQESKGACWARNKIQQHYNGEEYTLQLDSHHRFSKNWDETLLNMFNRLKSKGIKKPLLTGYIPSYEPKNDPAGRVTVPWKMNFDRFIPEGAVFFLPAAIPNHKTLSDPIPARFYSAHFCFTLGQFCKEVPHDPNYYFHGEEISIAVRAYTHGYDLFHPHIPVIWHEYTRNGRTKQWDDDKEWYKKNDACHLRNRKLFEMDGEKRDIDFGPYGFGNVRSLKDYEKYAGLCFKRRAVQKYTLDNNDPPNPQIYNSEEEFQKSFTSIFKHCIDIYKDALKETDYDFWCVAFKEGDKEIFRKDADENEIRQIMNTKDDFKKIWRDFLIEKKPTKWVVWPHSKSKGWCDKIEGNI